MQRFSLLVAVVHLLLLAPLVALADDAKQPEDPCTDLVGQFRQLLPSVQTSEPAPLSLQLAVIQPASQKVQHRDYFSLSSKTDEVINEVLTLLVEIGKKKGEQQGKALAKERLEDFFCGVRDNEGKLALATEEGNRVFPATCTLLNSSSLDSLINSPAQVRMAFYADVTDFLSGRVVTSLRNSGIKDGDKLATQLASPVAMVKSAVTKKVQHLSISQVELLLKELYKDQVSLGTNDDTRYKIAAAVALGKVLQDNYQNGTNGCSVPDLAEQGLANLFPDETKRREAMEDIVRWAEMVREILDTQEKTDEAEKALLRKYELAVQLAFEVAEKHEKSFKGAFDRSLEEAQAKLRSAIQAAKKTAEEVANATDDKTKKAAENKLAKMNKAVKIAQAAVDGMIVAKRSLSFLPALEKGLQSMLESNLPETIQAAADVMQIVCEEGKNCNSALLRREIALAKIVAQIASTYQIPPGKESDTNYLQQMHEQRKEYLESFMVSMTDRTNRESQWVGSLGMNIGILAAGYQSRRSTGAKKEEAVYGQVSVPLGISVQQLPQKSGWAPHWWPSHFMLTLFDLGQYLAWTEKTGLTEQRWETAVSPGVQIGWLLGRPGNAFSVGVIVSYAPFLFAEGGNLHSSNTGAFRAGAFLEYYLPIMDFN